MELHERPSVALSWDLFATGWLCHICKTKLSLGKAITKGSVNCQVGQRVAFLLQTLSHKRNNQLRQKHWPLVIVYSRRCIVGLSDLWMITREGFMDCSVPFCGPPDFCRTFKPQKCIKYEKSWRRVGQRWYYHSFPQHGATDEVEGNR